MPDSAVIVAMRDFKRGLLASEREQQIAMSRAWLGVERALDGNMAALAERMSNVARDGGTVSEGMLWQESRYRILLGQLTDELGKYTQYADRTITDRQAQLARLGIDHAARAIEAQGVRAGFARLPVEAVQNMVGLAGDGTPLRTLLTASWPDAAQGMTSALVRGVALGWNPRKTARAMAAGSTRSLDRMMKTARTESLRVYRESSRQSYINSGVVSGYARLATHDKRVCASCLLDEGHVYELDEVMPEHVQGRCAMIPYCKGVPNPQWKKGEEWFREQDAATQTSILGKGKYEAWQSGQFDLGELVTVKPNATWGDSLQVTPLRDLAGPRVARMVEAVARVPQIDLPYRPTQKQLDEVSKSVDFNVLLPNARRVGLSQDEYERALIDRMNQYVDGKVPRVRVGESSAQNILDDGRFKTQFETPGSGGTYNPKRRSEGEAKGLGAPADLAPNLRPVYGYYDTPQHAGGTYGSVEFVLKPSVVPRTTVSLGDSLGPMIRDGMIGTPANAITKHSLGDGFAARSLYAGDMAETYIEAQIHGGVRITDIEEIVLYRNKFNVKDLLDVEKAAAKAGVKVRYAN